MIKISLKDGSVKEYEKGISILDVAKDLSEGLARVALGGKVNDTIKSLDYKLEDDCDLSILTFNDKEGKSIYWHTTSHIMAQAVKRLFPTTKLAIGPSIENGFYYDFDNDRLSNDDLNKIETEMQKIIKENLEVKRFELPREEALNWAKGNQEPYKEELISELPTDAIISFYTQGEFTDLCAGPHLPYTGMVKAIKLFSVNGAYWRGSEKNKMLYRIYGISFNKKSELTEYLEKLEEAKKRDHRKLGKELELFTILDEGPGFPFFLPKGMELRNTLINYWREVHKEAEYQEISSPIILNKKLWETSGHWYNYKDNMYTTMIDEEDYAIKPMNCPGGILVYKSKMHSYRDLPIRLGELGLVHRHELSGALHGLMRVRNFTQDDAHIFLTKEQIKSEIKGVVSLIDKVYNVFGFKYHIELSTQPENCIGSDEDWDAATEALRQAITELGYDYKLNEGDGAFYGPKLDFHLEDCLGRTWQCGTIQLDFQLPDRFELEYIGADGEKHRPIMIHRVVFGSIERFIGILIEHYAGAFPLWLSPIQVKILPISEKHNEYANKVKDILTQSGIKVEVDYRNEKIGYKIREAQINKYPYMLIIGEKEMESGSVAVRSRKDGDKGVVPLEEFKNSILEEIKNRVNN